MIKSSILIVIFKGNHSAAIFLFKSHCLWLAASLSLGCVQVQAFFSIYALLLLVSEVIPTYDSCQNYVSFSIYIFIPTLDFFFSPCVLFFSITQISPRGTASATINHRLFSSPLLTPLLYTNLIYHTLICILLMKNAF